MALPGAAELRNPQSVYSPIGGSQSVPEGVYVYEGLA
jgi:hypothetical protein